MPDLQTAMRHGRIAGAYVDASLVDVAALGAFADGNCAPCLRQFSLSDVDVSIFEPAGAPSTKDMATSSRVPRMTTGRAALVVLMNQYLGGLLDPFVTLLQVHKLMYFMQEAGEPLRLDYVQATYGPYAQNLRHVLRAVEGHPWVGVGWGQFRPARFADASHFTFVFAHG